MIKAGDVVAWGVPLINVGYVMREEKDKFLVKSFLRVENGELIPYSQTALLDPGEDGLTGIYRAPEWGMVGER